MKVTIETVANGFLVTVTQPGNQSLYDSEKTYIAQTVNEVTGIVIREMSDPR